ncbi:hypothetical protein DWY40_06915, partial [Ruminococcus sp. AF25-17]
IIHIDKKINSTSLFILTKRLIRLIIFLSILTINQLNNITVLTYRTFLIPVLYKCKDSGK